MKTSKIVNVLILFIIFVSTLLFLVGCTDDQIILNSDPRLLPTISSGTGGLSDVVVNSNNITLTIWDDGTVDGDSISIYHNNNVLLLNHELVGSPGTDIKVNLKSGKNAIKITALNQGLYGDNTAAIKITNVVTGDSEQHYYLLTGESATFNIIVK